jgi:hypothetical protein
MPDAITQKLLTERDDIVGRANGVKKTAVESNRDLTDNEKQTLTNFRERIESIDEQLKFTTISYDLDTQTRENLARMNGPVTQVRDGNPWEGATAGQVLWDYLHAHQDRDASARVQAFTRTSQRAAEHMGTTAAVTVPVAGGFGGLIVAPVVGPIIDLSGPDMPLTMAIGSQDAPNGFQFSRPRIVDPDLNTAAGPQAGGKEKAELPSKKFDLASDLINMTTIGNYLNLSLQAQTFVPGALDIVIRQLNRRTSRGIEKATVTALTTGALTIPLADDADAATVQAAIFEGAAAVFTATGRMPSWGAVGPAGWARLGGLTDLAGRPIFPTLNPANAVGTANATEMSLTVAGLPLIVSAGITDEDIFMGNSEGIELYGYRYPLLQATEPSLLGTQIAVAASLGSYKPPTTEAGPSGTPAAKYEAIVKLGD